MADQNPPLVPSLQMLVNQANQDAPPKSMVLAPPASPAPPPEPSYVLRNSGGTNPLLTQEPAVEPHGLNGYLPRRPNANDEEIASYRKQANEALAAQGGGLDTLQGYIQQMQAKPQGINWTPLAAYIDSQNPKSKMLEAAKAMAPMSPEERDKQLFDLQVKLQGGRAAMSADQLKALGEQIKMRHDNDRDAQQKKYQDGMLEVAQQKADSIPDRLKSQQTLAAERQFLNDPDHKLNLPRINGAIRLLDLINAGERGEFATNKALLEQANQESSRLETGANAVAQGTQEATALHQAAANLRSVVDSVRNKVTSANLKPQFTQLRGTVGNMGSTYLSQMDARNDVIMAGATPIQQEVFAAKAKAMHDGLARRLSATQSAADASDIHPDDMTADQVRAAHKKLKGY